LQYDVCTKYESDRRKVKYACTTTIVILRPASRGVLVRTVAY
jgi:hypothetical protein